MNYSNFKHAHTQNRNIYLCNLSLSFLMLIPMDNTILVKCLASNRVMSLVCSWKFHRTDETSNGNSKGKRTSHWSWCEWEFAIVLLRWKERGEYIGYTVIESLRAEVNFHLNVTPKLSASMGTSFSYSLFPISFRFHTTEVSHLFPSHISLIFFIFFVLQKNLLSFLRGDSQFIVRTQFDSKKKLHRNERILFFLFVLYLCSFFVIRFFLFCQ